MSEENHDPRERETADGSVVNDEHAKKQETLQSKTFKLLVIIGRIILVAVVFSVAMVVCLRWVPPPISTVMLERQIGKFFRGEHQPPIRYRWVAWESISPYLPLAVVAAEDQKFPHHCGFDVKAIAKVMATHKPGDRLRGASTITQQVAKNLFLWSGRSYVRKGLEAYMTILLEVLWSKKRILEVYVNIAEFGDGIYGVSAAAEMFLGKSPSDLTRGEAARLAAVLTNPRRLNVRNPSSYVSERGRWIEKQMDQLGGIGYLRDL
jgi:monofunctional biosynthetic peptidoglycan transglycosylase